MMETNFTRSNFLVKCLVVLLLSIFSTFNSFAQSCACKESVQVSLDEEGNAEVTAAMLLADNSTCGGNIQIVTVMKTPNGAPIPGSPNVDCTQVGKTLYGKVSNGTNSCWSRLLVEDKIKPTIDCPTGVLPMTCTQMSTFIPGTDDNCAVAKLDTISETVTVNNCSNFPANVLKRIVRVYQATDIYGNKSLPCTITFDVLRIADLNDIVMPAPYLVVNDTELECDGDWAKLANGNPSPVDIGSADGTGVPTLGNINLYPDPHLYCNLIVTYTDIKLPKIGCVTKIMRSWQVIEWSCDNRSRAPFVQMIEIKDTEGPSISGLQNITVSTSNHVCEANVTFANAILADNCSKLSDLTLDITVYPNGGPTPGVFIKHGSPKVAQLPVGTHLAVYTAYDDCYNSTTASIVVEVEDNTPPVAICDEFATVGLTSDGTAWVPATVFDDGSYDECALGKMLVRRMNNNNCAPCETPEFPGFTYLGVYGPDGEKHYYYLSNHISTPKIALKTAKAMGGYVVSLETPAEDAWVWERYHAVANITAPDWIDLIIGLTDLDGDGKYKWESGSNATYRNWGNTYNQPYIVKYHDENGIWYGYQPIYNAKYIVEITDPCGWSSSAQFCCADIGSNQMVGFRVIDKSGNYNDCMVSTVIQDKIGPVITCPGDRTVACDFAYDPKNLRKDFGWPTATDNCENPTIREDSIISINNCRIGTITRTFTVTDRGGRTASCTQTITFRPDRNQVYNGPTIPQWPRDTMIVGCGNPADAAYLPSKLGTPILTDGACSLVGAQSSDQAFSFNNPSGVACFKILRTWTVIDWCQPSDGGGYRTWTHTQEIKVIDNTAPVFATLAPSVSVDTYDVNCEAGLITLTASATDVCTAVLKWSYKIDAGIDGVFDIFMSGTGNSINASGVYPVGNHKIVYSFEDKCGNVASKEQLFSIVNRKAPNAYVKNGLSISLMKMPNGTGSAEIWATDFDNGSSHPCGYRILLSFTPVTVVNGVMVGTPNLVFTCSNKGKNNVTIYVAALTPAGDVVQSSVTTFIDVQDNATPKICPPTGGKPSVNGSIATETNAHLENAQVSLVGSELNLMTGNDGAFSFPNMNEGGNYILTPDKNDDIMNGVSTLDLVMIQRHILSIEKLKSAYKLIAADVNKDGKITAADLVELRKLVLGTTSSFSNNRSWRFVDKTYTFQDASYAQGEAFPEVYNIENLQTDMTTDFVAVKIGDVNGNVKANNVNTVLENRVNNNLVLTTDNTSFVAGQKVVIPVKAGKNIDITGMQFTLNFDTEALSLDGVEGAGMDVKESNFGFDRADNGQLTASWNDATNVTLKEGQVLFNLIYTAKKNGLTSEIISVGSELTKAEAYTSDEEVMGVQWIESERNAGRGFVLHQNTPNPFKEITLIGFELPEAMPATITIYDVTGKVVKTNTIKGLKGYNTIDINKNEVNAGVMYYSLRAGEFSATRKMVVIE